MDAHFKNETVQAVWDTLVVRNPEQSEFLQAAEEVLATIEPVFEQRPDLLPVLSSLVEPERQIIFRVPWMDDAGNTLVNRGFRVQFNSAIGPYKGGLRFHPSANLSILKFLGFEQIFKNSLTTLAMGGGKGGSDFDPKGKSDTEVMRFCQSFMTELYRHIGADTDIPAGDIGVGGREIGYLFGHYKRLTTSYEGVLTGKGLPFSGSLLRPEATGYGLVYFSQEMLQSEGETLQGKRVAVSGSGNVSMFCAEKLLDLGAVPVSLSDSGGTLYVPGGISGELLAQLYDMKINKRKRLSECMGLADGLQYAPGQRPWQVVADVSVAMPCATQNELELEDAKALIRAGVKFVAEGANMPSAPTAIKALHEAGVLFGPAKAANAGGVAVSGLEMAQNSSRLSWTKEEVDARLQDIMKGIYNSCVDAARQYNTTLQAGANIAGFIKVAEAMLAQGCV